jgi:hypothetical protein
MKCFFCIKLYILYEIMYFYYSNQFSISVYLSTLLEGPRKRRSCFRNPDGSQIQFELDGK